MLSLLTLAALGMSTPKSEPKEETAAPDPAPEPRVAVIEPDVGRALSRSFARLSEAARGAVTATAAFANVLPVDRPLPVAPPEIPERLAIANERNERRRKRNLDIKARGGFRS